MAGKICLLMVVSFFPAFFLVDRVIGIRIRRRWRRQSG